MAPWLIAAALGFAKGWVLAPRPGTEQEFAFNAENDVYAPVKEELLYRAAPLTLFPKAPFGSTAVPFAVDHAIDMLREGSPSAGELVARLGEVFLGGLLYESAYRTSGIVGAVAAHSLHNLAIGFGVRMRRKLA